MNADGCRPSCEGGGDSVVGRLRFPGAVQCVGEFDAGGVQGSADPVLAVTPWCIGVGRTIADEVDAVADAGVEQDAGGDASRLYLVG